MPQDMHNPWSAHLERLRVGLADIEQAQTALAELHDRASADIVRYLRASGGVDLDLEAIQATVIRPYTLVPLDQQKALLIHWRGVKLPIFGWVKKQEASFTVSEITRGMDLLTPLPDWMKSEMGWKPPEHQAVLDAARTGVRVLAGDAETFKKRYGAHLGAKQADGTFRIKPGDAWIKLVAQLVKDGILPWQAQPGRLLHAQQRGAHYLLFTPEEMQKFRPRIYGIEAELAGEVDIEFATVGKVSEPKERGKLCLPIHQRGTAKPKSSVKAAPAATALPQTEVERALANRAVQRALDDAYARSTERVRRSRALHRVLTFGWNGPFTLDTLLIAGRVKRDWLSVYKAACEAAVMAKLMQRVGDSYQTDRSWINQLIKASEQFK